MRKIEIFEQQAPKDEPLRLRLIGDSGGPIRLYVVNERGEPISLGCLLTITTSGHINRHVNVDPAFGLPLDARGRVKMDSE